MVMIDGHLRNRRVWRTYNVIRDGNLVLPKLIAILTKESFMKLQDANVIDKKEVFEETKYYTLDLTQLKVISSAWAHADTLGLVDLLKEEQELMLKQTALNALIKTLPKPDADKAPFVDNSSRQEDPIYYEKPVDVPEFFDTYQATCVNIRLVKKVKQDFDFTKLTYEEAILQLNMVKTRLVVIRFISRAIIFAMETMKNKTFNWDEGEKRQRGSNTKLEQLSEDKTLKRVVWTEDVKY